MEEDSGHRDIENRDAADTPSARAPSGASTVGRRGLIAGLAMFIAAPAIVRASSLMAISPLPIDPLEAAGWERVPVVLTRLWIVTVTGTGHYKVGDIVEIAA